MARIKKTARKKERVVLQRPTMEDELCCHLLLYFPWAKQIVGELRVRCMCCDNVGTVYEEIDFNAVAMQKHADTPGHVSAMIRDPALHDQEKALLASLHGLMQCATSTAMRYRAARWASGVPLP